MDFEEQALLWLKNNDVTPTIERIKSLCKLLAKFENDAYNDGLRY